VLSEVQAEHERVKEAVVKHIEVLEHLLYFQMSKKHKFGKILQVLDRIFYVTTIFKEADQNERLLQRSIFLKECGRIKRNLRSMEK
jgi:hypothetical protein